NAFAISQRNARDAFLKWALQAIQLVPVSRLRVPTEHAVASVLRTCPSPAHEDPLGSYLYLERASTISVFALSDLADYRFYALVFRVIAARLGAFTNGQLAPLLRSLQHIDTSGSVSGESSYIGLSVPAWSVSLEVAAVGPITRDLSAIA